MVPKSIITKPYVVCVIFCLVVGLLLSFAACKVEDVGKDAGEDIDALDVELALDEDTVVVPNEMEEDIKLVQQFIADTSREELNEIVSNVDYLLVWGVYQFASLDELPMVNVFNFFASTDGVQEKIDALPESEMYAEIPVADWKQFVATYFGDYPCNPEELVEPGHTRIKYDADKQIIYLCGINGGGFWPAAIGEDMMVVDLTPQGEYLAIDTVHHYFDNSYVNDYMMSHLVLQITDNGYQYQSYSYKYLPSGDKISLPFRGADLQLEGVGFLAGCLELADMKAVLGTPDSVKRFADFGRCWGERWKYDDIQLDFRVYDYNDNTGSLLRLFSTSPDFSFVKGIVVGDSIDKVISRFKNENFDKSTFFTQPASGNVKTLYGENGQCGGFIIYEGDTPIIRYIDRYIMLTFHVDTNERVSMIEVLFVQ